ncbi:MAG: hypothetical protein ACRDH8_14320 [Actinomycetota bacterium]
MSDSDFVQFRDSLQRLGGAVAIDPEDQAGLEAAAAEIERLPRITTAAVTTLVRQKPEWIQALGLCVRLSREQLRGVLRQRFGTESFRRIGEGHAKDLVDALDSEFHLLEELRTQRSRRWSFSDVLLERHASRLRAAGSIGRGRRVEDLVEAVVNDVGLPHEMRTRFTGKAGETGPCDLAIPAGGAEAQIITAIKGFDSTGSKLTDAAQEIARMADIRLPKQFVFAVIDGVGWLRRQADLKRIYGLLEKNSIDGLYSISQLGDFRTDLRDAALRLRLI